MAWRIEENVVRGEIDNRAFGRVHGKVWLNGRDNPLVLELTGNCHKDLAGCRLTFTNPAPKSESTVAAPGPARKLARSTTFKPLKT